MHGHSLDPLLYYKLKTAQLQLALMDSQYQQRRAELLSMLHGLLREAGVEPTGAYQLLDESCMLLPVNGTGAAPTVGTGSVTV
jgi:hypothetical protein